MRRNLSRWSVLADDSPPKAKAGDKNPILRKSTKDFRFGILTAGDCTPDPLR